MSFLRSTSASAARNRTSRFASVSPRSKDGTARGSENFPKLTMARSRTNHMGSRASSLRRSKSGLAFDLLSELARDPIWFVRLRAIVSLGKFSDPRAVPSLLRGLTDANRLVRLRAAEALVDLKKDMAPIFERVVETGDRYGLHAYLTALENSNL